MKYTVRYVPTDEDHPSDRLVVTGPGIPTVGFTVYNWFGNNPKADTIQTDLNTALRMIDASSPKCYETLDLGDLVLTLPETVSKRVMQTREYRIYSQHAPDALNPEDVRVEGQFFPFFYDFKVEIVPAEFDSPVIVQ